MPNFSQWFWFRRNNSNGHHIQSVSTYIHNNMKHNSRTTHSRDMKLFPIFLLVVIQWLPRRAERRSFMFFFRFQLALVWQLWGIFLAQQLLNTAAPPPSQWGAEMEVNFKPYKRCHKLHLMALGLALTAERENSPTTTHRHLFSACLHFKEIEEDVIKMSL